MIEYGKLCHSHLKVHQKIRLNEPHDDNAKEAINLIINFLKSFHLTDIETIAWETWKKVRIRNWQLNPNTTHLERGK